MRKFRGYLSIGLVGRKREIEFELEDEADENEIDEAIQDEIANIVDVWVEEVR